MEQRTQHLLGGLLLAIIVVGCGQQQFSPNNLTDAQRIYRQNKWGSTEPLVMVSKLASGAVNVNVHDSTQYALEFRDGHGTIYYSELVPSSFGVKSFHGAGRLVAISNLTVPVFIVKSETLAEENNIKLVGFSGNRMFKVYSVGFSGDPTSPSVRLAEMVQVATNACAELKRLSDENQ